MISTHLIGNIGKDAEVKEVNGKKVINFSVAVEVGTKVNKRTLWVECGKWGETTAVAPYLLKGTKVYVEGIPDLNLYKKNDGEPGGSIRLLVNKIELLGGQQQAATSPSVPGNAMDKKVEEVADTEGLPF